MIVLSENDILLLEKVLPEQVLDLAKTVISSGLICRVTMVEQGGEWIIDVYENLRDAVDNISIVFISFTPNESGVVFSWYLEEEPLFFHDIQDAKRHMLDIIVDALSREADFMNEKIEKVKKLLEEV